LASPETNALVDDLSDDAPEKLETAEDGGTRRLAIEMLALMEAMDESSWPFPEPQCAWSRVAVPL
jgi:hypothetical protein